MMFDVPVLYNSHDQMVPITPHDIQLHKPRCRFRSLVPCDDDMFDLCCMLMRTRNVRMPTSADEGVRLYLLLREEVKSIL